MIKKESKRAESEDNVLHGPVIFTILNLIFISILIGFILLSSSGAFVYEQVYSKQIALLLDKAQPEMVISLDIPKAIEIAEKNGVSKENIFNINAEKNEVIVKLSKREGYSYKYFSDYKINHLIQGDKLIINIQSKEPVNEESRENGNNE